MQTIYLDISNKGVIPTIYAKQGDVGRKFRVLFTNSGLPYDLEGSLFSVWYKGDSGEGNYTHIGENSAFSIQKNTVEVEMITQMLSVCGNGIICLVLSNNDKQIGSWNIPYICEEVPGFESEPANEYYTAFSETVEELNSLIGKTISLGDYIEEQGNGVFCDGAVKWNWRKWASGVAEIWGTVDPNEITEEWVDLPIVVWAAPLDLPVPTVTYSVGDVALGLFSQSFDPTNFEWESEDDDEGNVVRVTKTKWQTPHITIYSEPEDGNIVPLDSQYTIDVHMVGRWKPVDDEPSKEILAVNVGGNGAAIDDDNISTKTTWSSQKISTEIGKGGGGGGSADAVLYTKQTLTNAQKTQARENIGATLDVLKAMGKETKRVDNLDEVTENGFYVGYTPDYEELEWYCIVMTGSDNHKVQLCISSGWEAAMMLVRIMFDGDDIWNNFEVGLNVEELVAESIESNMEYITQSVIDALPVYEGED